MLGDDDSRVSTREIVDAHGIDLELLQRVQRTIGLPRVDDPDAAVHPRADAEVAAYVKDFVDLGFEPDDLVSVVRVLAEGLSHAAEVMRHTALAVLLEPGITELEIAKRAQEMTTRVRPLLGPWIEDMLFMHLRHQMQTEAVTAGERAAGSELPGARDVCVAFADLVGFTQLGERVAPEELEHLANQLADHAREVAVVPVRLIKTIGDAVMFVSADAAPLVEAVVGLVEVVAADAGFPPLRAGIASGTAVSRAGDWFGSPVNLASRVTGVARPGSILVTEPVRLALGDDGFGWSFAGARRLKGVAGEVKLFRARSAGQAGVGSAK